MIKAIFCILNQSVVSHLSLHFFFFFFFFSRHHLVFADRCYYADMPPPSDIVKVAIEWPGANAQLIEMDQVRAAFAGTARASLCNQRDSFFCLFAETGFVFNNPGSM